MRMRSAWSGLRAPSGTSFLALIGGVQRIADEPAAPVASRSRSRPQSDPTGRARSILAPSVRSSRAPARESAADSAARQIPGAALDDVVAPADFCAPGSNNDVRQRSGILDQLPRRGASNVAPASACAPAHGIVPVIPHAPGTLGADCTARIWQSRVRSGAERIAGRCSA